MNRLKTAAAALLLLLAVPTLSRAEAGTVTIETKWNEKTVQMTTTSVTAATFDIGGFGAAGGAVLYNAAVFNGADGTTQNASSVVTSTWTNVIASDYSLLAVGSTGTLKIAQTVRMPSPRGSVNASPLSFNSPYPSSYYLTAPTISTSSAITLPLAVQQNHTFRAQVTNPVFILTNLSPAATYFLTVTYLVPIR